MLTRLARLVLLKSLIAGSKFSLEEMISEGVHPVFSSAVFSVTLVMLTPVSYFIWMTMVGEKLALLTDISVICLFGTVLDMLCLISARARLAGLVLALVVWLLLGKCLHEKSWSSSTAVGMLATLILVIVNVFSAPRFRLLQRIVERLSFSLFHFHRWVGIA